MPMFAKLSLIYYLAASLFSKVGRRVMYECLLLMLLAIRVVGCYAVFRV